MKTLNDFLCTLPKVNVEELKKLQYQLRNIENINQISSRDINDILNETRFGEEKLEELKEIFKKILEYNKKLNSFTLNIFDEDYPEKLLNIRNIPKILYLKGNANLLKAKFSMGVVGSRKPSSYGIWATKSIVKELVYYGFCIISGMADGIDSVSHREALRENGETICVFGSPVSKIYPAKNKKLASEVVEKGGLIISEHSPLEDTLPAFFALRNRIISGLSDGLLVTEAGAKSGTLITANFALEQGKNIFAIPGNINSSNSQGTNKLIKDGACMVTSVSDILTEYNIDELEIEKIQNIDELSELENKVLNFIKSQGSCHSESVAIKLDIKIEDAVSIMNILSIKGYIEYDGFLASVKII